MKMITEIKHIILNLQLDIEKIEFERFPKKGSADRNPNSFILSANGFLFSNGRKIFTNQIIITN